MEVVLHGAQPAQDPPLRAGIYLMAPSAGALSTKDNPQKHHRWSQPPTEQHHQHNSRPSKPIGDKQPASEQTFSTDSLGVTCSRRSVALTDLERKRCERDLAKFMERRRPPPHIRSELDIGYRISGHSVEIFEIRPDWQNPKETMEHPVAKATFMRTKNRWRVFWMRRDPNGTDTSQIWRSTASKRSCTSSIEMNTVVSLDRSMSPNLDVRW
ncbi:MAG: DUF3024 domain-containing protein [Gammaproteobacteria bacterium]